MVATADRPRLAGYPQGRAESIGGLLARARADRGMSQLRLAELLCAAAGSPTVTRHEISRWERDQRVPGAHWLRWLALVLEVPTDELETAAAVARGRRGCRPTDLADHRSGDLTRLAHTWLAVPGDLAKPTDLLANPPDVTGPRGRHPTDSPPQLDVLTRRVRELRRMDDLVGGVDLADTVDGELRALLAPMPGSRPARRLLSVLAELAQLAGWTAADAGRTRAALRAYRTGLAAAEAAGDRPLGAHVLGCLSHLVAPRDPRQALLIARTAYAGARPAGAASVRVLLQHRIAFAAALAGDRRASEEALAAAERLADRRATDREPGWLYWLDEAELTALAGRCFAALRRPLRAEPLLRQRLERPDAGGPRTTALDGGWLAQAYLDAGEVEQACAIAGRALVAAVRSGSPRAATRALLPAARLAEAGAGRAGREYAELVAAARPYLPGGADVGQPTRRARLGGTPSQGLAFPG